MDKCAYLFEVFHTTPWTKVHIYLRLSTLHSGQRYIFIRGSPHHTVDKGTYLSEVIHTTQWTNVHIYLRFSTLHSGQMYIFI